MRFDQTRDILQHQVAEYHRALSRLYRDCTIWEVSPRNRLMLDYLVEHEARLALAIDEFLAEAPHEALDYWFKRIEQPFPVPDPALLTKACLTDLDQLIGAAIRFRTALIAFYDHLLQQCDAEQTATLFRTLRDQEEQGMRRFVRQAQGLADL
jgi:rubrerythrin